MQKKKLKVLIVQPWISYRGAETVSVNQCYYLNKTEHEAKIACLFVDWERLPPHGDEIEYVLPSNLLSSLLAKSKFFFLIFGFPLLFYLVLKNVKEFDVLNPHNLPSIWVCALATKFSKIQCIWTAHGVPQKSALSGGFLERTIRFLGLNIIDKWSVKKIGKVVSVSQKVAREVKAYYGVASEIIYPGIETAFYLNGDRFKVREKFKIGSNDFLILYIARLHPAKQPLIALGAFEQVSAKIPTAKLLFAGEGTLEKIINKHSLRSSGDDLKQSLRSDELEKLKIKNLRDKDLRSLRPWGLKVILTGFVNPKEVKDYYAASDLILVPYWQTEGCPLTPFEALVSGKVSVVAKGSGADEIIEKEGIGLIADPNPKSFAEIILWSYSHPGQIKRIGEKGEAYVKKNLSGEIYAQQFIDLL